MLENIIHKHTRLLLVVLADLGRDLVAIRADTASPRCLSNHFGICAQTAFRERFPDQASVGSTREHLVGLNDRITSVRE